MGREGSHGQKALVPFCLPRLPPLAPLLVSRLVALPTAEELPREGKGHPPPEVCAQEVSFTPWPKGSLKEALTRREKPKLEVVPRREELR